MKLEFFCIYKGENWWKTKAILQTVKLHGYENEASLHTEKVIGSQNRIYFKLEFPMVWHETSKLEVLGIFMALFAKWFRSQEKDYDNTRYYCTLHDLNRFFPNLEDTLEPYHKDARSDYFDASWMLPVFTAQGLHYLHQLGFATLAAKAYFDHFNKMPHSNKILSKANHAAIKDLRVKIETRMKELSNYQSQTLEDLTTIYKKNFKNSIFDTNPTLTLDSLFKEVSNEINEYIKNVQTSEISTIKDRVESIMLLAKDKDMDPEDILDHLFKNIHFKSNYDIKRWINGDKGSEFAMNYFCQLIKGLIQNVDDQIIYIWHLGNKLDEEYQISHGIIKYLLSLGNSYSISHKHSYHIRLDKVHFEPKANTTIKQELNSYIFAKVLDLDPIGQITPLKLLIEKFNRDQLSLDFYFKFWVLKILKRTEISFNCHNVLLEAFIEFKPKESELYEIQIKALDDYMLNKNKEERVNYITSKAEQILQTTQNLGKDYLKLSIKLIFDKSILNFRSFHEFLKDAPKLEDKIIEHFRSIFSTPVELYSKIKDILQDSNNSKFSSSEVIRAGRIFFTMDDNDPKYDSVKRGLNNLLDDLKNKRVPLNFVSLLIRKLDSKQEIPYESNQERQKTITSIISAITLEDPTPIDEQERRVSAVLQDLASSLLDRLLFARQLKTKLPGSFYDRSLTICDRYACADLILVLEGGIKEDRLDLLLEQIELQAGNNTEVFDIFKTKALYNRFVSSILTTMVKRLKKVDFKERNQELDRLVGRPSLDYLPDLVKELRTYWSNFEMEGMKLTLIDGARLQNKAVEVFEDIVADIALTQNSRYHELGKIIIDDRLEIHLYDADADFFKKLETTKRLEIICQDEFKLLHRLNNMVWLKNTELIISLIAFIQGWSSTKFKIENLEIVDQLKKLLDHNTAQTDISKMDPLMIQNLIHILFNFDKLKDFASQLKLLEKLLDESSNIDDKTFSLLTLGDENSDNRSTSLVSKDVIFIKNLKKVLIGNSSWHDLIEKLAAKFQTDEDKRFLINSIIKNADSMQKKLSNLKSNLQGTYQQKPKKILKLNESSIFRFYKGKGKDQYSLQSYITDDHERKFDMEQSLEYNLKIEQNVMVKEDITKQSNIVDQDDFDSLKIKADFLKQIDNEPNNDWNKFCTLADLSYKILDNLKFMEKNHLVTDLIVALNSNLIKNNPEFLKIEIFHHKKEGFKSISVSINLKDSVKSKELEHLCSITEELKKKCEEEKFDVFNKQLIKYYQWTSFQAHQVQLIDKYLKQLQTKEDSKKLFHLRKKVEFLFKYSETKISLESIENIFKIPRSLSEITYSFIKELNGLLGDQESNPNNFNTNRRNSKFSYVKFDQENRIESMVRLTRKDKDGKIPRCFFCSFYSNWREIEVFLLRGLYDLEENTYLIVDPHLLVVDVRHKLFFAIQSSLEQTNYKVNTNIKIMTPTNHPSKIDLEISTRYKEIFSNDPFDDKEICIISQNRLTMVNSKYAGLGKTYFIEHNALQKNFSLMVLNLTGKMTPAILKRRLLPIYNKLNSDDKNSKVALRIKLGITEGVQDDFHYLDQLLFKICVLNKIEFGSTYLGFEDVAHFYIEVQNTLDQKLTKTDKTLGQRLLNIDFLKYLGGSPETHVTLMPPLKFETEEKTQLAQGDPNNLLNPDELAKIGLFDCALLHFLSSHRLIEDTYSYGKLQTEKLIHYINPDQIIHPIINYFIDCELKELKASDYTINKEFFRSAEVKELIELKENIDNLCLEEQLSPKYDRFKLLTEEKEEQLQILISSIKKLMPPGYTVQFVLIKFLFSPKQLEEDVRNWDILKISRSDDLWLALLLYCSNLFHEKYGILLSAYYFKKKEEKRKIGLECLQSMLGLDGTEEVDSMQIKDINYYHIKTLFKLSQQFTQQLQRAQILVVSSLLGSKRKTSTADSDVLMITTFRRALTDKIFEQNRNFAFKQILSISKLQRQSHNKIEKHESADEEDYEDLVEHLKQAANITENWFFLHDGVVKLVFSNPNSLDRDLVRFYKSQVGPKTDLYAPKSQRDYLQEIIESFQGFAASSDGIESHIQSYTEDDIKKAIDNIETSISEKNKRFMITADNYLKIRLILQRAEIGIPIILLGESGCGKTFMIEFISEQLFKEDFQTMTFHSGVTETELATLISECIKQAKSKPKARVWLFLDEINTTPLLPNIAELITERRAHFLEQEDNQLPDNIVIVAACNPYQLGEGDHHFGRGKSLQNQLVHKVYPLPENLISYCFNYGQLSEDDEKTMIKTILDDAFIRELNLARKSTNPSQQNELIQQVKQNSFMKEIVENKLREEADQLLQNKIILSDKFKDEVEQFRDSLADCLSLGQQTIRKHENASAASLRDVRRFVNLLKTFIDRQIPEWTLKNCLKLTFYSCYCNRIQLIEKRIFSKSHSSLRFSGEHMQSFNQFVEEKLKLNETDNTTIDQFFTQESSKLVEEAKKYDSENLQVQDKVEMTEDKSTMNEEKEVTESVLQLPRKRMSCFDGIAINRPLMENVFILLHSFISGIPVYISGRPGTSKSVSIQVVEAIFKLEAKVKEGTKYFKGLKKAKFYPLWGSKNTTARHVQEAFARVKQIAEAATDKDVLRVIYFEEMELLTTMPTIL